MLKDNEVYAMSWTEVEIGWGQRSDGYTIHATVDDFNETKSRIHNTRFLKNGEVADEFTVPDNEIPYIVTVDKEIKALANKSKTIWLDHRTTDLDLKSKTLSIKNTQSNQELLTNAQSAYLESITPNANNVKKPTI